MPHADSNRQPDNVDGSGLDEADSLGPDYRQRITPLGQAFLSPKRLEPVSRPHMAVLDLSPAMRPLGLIQRWPNETFISVAEGIVPSADALVDSPSRSFLDGLPPDSIQPYPADSPEAAPLPSSIIATDTPTTAAAAAEAPGFQAPLESKPPSNSIPIHHQPGSPNDLNGPNGVPSSLQRQSQKLEELNDPAQPSKLEPEPNLQRPTPAPVQVSQNARIPAPARRSPQLQRRVKRAKAKILRSLQSQRSHSPKVLNTAAPQQLASSSAQGPAIQPTQESPAIQETRAIAASEPAIATDQTSNAASQPQPRPQLSPAGDNWPLIRAITDTAITPTQSTDGSIQPAGDESAQTSPTHDSARSPASLRSFNQEVKPVLERSSEDSRPSELAQRSAAHSTATPEPGQSFASDSTNDDAQSQPSESTEVNRVTQLLQRPETVKRQIQHSKGRILRTIQTPDADKVDSPGMPAKALGAPNAPSDASIQREAEPPTSGEFPTKSQPWVSKGDPDVQLLPGKSEASAPIADSSLQHLARNADPSVQQFSDGEAEAEASLQRMAAANESGIVAASAQTPNLRSSPNAMTGVNPQIQRATKSPADPTSASSSSPTQEERVSTPSLQRRVESEIENGRLSNATAPLPTGSDADSVDEGSMSARAIAPQQPNRSPTQPAAVQRESGSLERGSPITAEDAISPTHESLQCYPAPSQLSSLGADHSSDASPPSTDSVDLVVQRKTAQTDTASPSSNSHPTKSLHRVRSPESYIPQSSDTRAEISPNADSSLQRVAAANPSGMAAPSEQASDTQSPSPTSKPSLQSKGELEGNTSANMPAQEDASSLTHGSIQSSSEPNQASCPEPDDSSEASLQLTNSADLSIQTEVELSKASSDVAETLPWVREPDPYLHPSPRRGAVSAPNADSSSQEMTSAPSLQRSAEIENDSVVNTSARQDVSYETLSGTQPGVSILDQGSPTLASKPIQRSIAADSSTPSEELTPNIQNVSASTSISSTPPEVDGVEARVSEDTLQRDFWADSAAALPEIEDSAGAEAIAPQQSELYHPQPDSVQRGLEPSGQRSSTEIKDASSSTHESIQKNPELSQSSSLGPDNSTEASLQLTNSADLSVQTEAELSKAGSDVAETLPWVRGPDPYLHPSPGRSAVSAPNADSGSQEIASAPSLQRSAEIEIENDSVVNASVRQDVSYEAPSGTQPEVSILDQGSPTLASEPIQRSTEADAESTSEELTPAIENVSAPMSISSTPSEADGVQARVSEDTLQQDFLADSAAALPEKFEFSSGKEDSADTEAIAPQQSTPLPQPNAVQRELEPSERSSSVDIEDPSSSTHGAIQRNSAPSQPSSLKLDNSSEASLQWTDSTEPSVQRETAQRDAEPLKASDDGAKPLPWVREPDPYIHPSPGRGAVSAPNADSMPQEIASAPSLQRSAEIENDSSANNSISQDVSYEPSSRAQSEVSRPNQENAAFTSESVQRAIQADADAPSEELTPTIQNVSARNVSAPTSISSTPSEADGVQARVSEDTLQRDFLADSAAALPEIEDSAGAEAIAPQQSTPLPQPNAVQRELEPSERSSSVDIEDPSSSTRESIQRNLAPNQPSSLEPDNSSGASLQWTDSTEPSVQRETAQRDAEPLEASDDGAKPLPWVREPDPYIHPSPRRGAVSAPNADSRPQEIASAPSLQCSTEIKNDSSANNSTSQDVSYEPSSGAQSVVSVPYQENETLASEPVQRAIKAEVDARSEASLEKLTSASQNVSAPNAVSSFGAEADDVQSLISKDTLQRDLLADSATSLPAASDNHISDNHVGNGAGFVESVRPKVGTAVPQRPQLSPKLQPEALPVETSASLTTVAQLLAEDAVPPHPLSVAPAMTVIQPPTAMGVVQPLTEANEAASDGFADKEAAGLFSAPQTNRHQANMAKASDNRLEQQRRDDERDKQLDLRRTHYLPPGVISGVHGPSSPGLMGDTAESKTMMQDALYAKANMKANFEARQGKPVSKISADEMGELAPKLVPRAELKAQSETKEDKANEKDMEVDGHSFELLAREVYHLLQQRLTVERERYGGYYRDRANL